MCWLPYQNDLPKFQSAWQAICEKSCEQIFFQRWKNSEAYLKPKSEISDGVFDYFRKKSLYYTCEWVGSKYASETVLFHIFIQRSLETNFI